MNAAAFLADLLAHDMSVLASRSGKLELLVYRTVLNCAGDGYREIPRHPDTDAVKARFDALTESERAELSGCVLGLPKQGEAGARRG